MLARPAVRPASADWQMARIVYPRGPRSRDPESEACRVAPTAMTASDLIPMFEVGGPGSLRAAAMQATAAGAPPELLTSAQPWTETPAWARQSSAFRPFGSRESPAAGDDDVATNFAGPMCAVFKFRGSSRLGRRPMSPPRVRLAACEPVSVRGS